MDLFDIYDKSKSILYNSLNSIKKRKNIDLFKKQNSLVNKNELIILNYITLFFFFKFISIVNAQEQIMSKNTYITFKIKKKGNIKLFNPLDKNDCKKITLPNIIQIEGVNYTNIEFNYYINNTLNN